MSFPYRLRYNTVIRIKSDWDLYKLEDVITDWLVIDGYLMYVVPPSHEVVCVRPRAFACLKRNSTSTDRRLLIVDMAMMTDLQHFNQHLWATFRRDMKAQCPACGVTPSKLND